MKVYRGDRTIDGLQVTVDDNPLPPRTDIRAISDDGFEWSFEGDAPAQLALAILADHLGNDRDALRLHDAFMREIVANFSNEWEMSSLDVQAAIDALDG